MNYSGAEIIIRMLENAGIEAVAGIPGGANLPLYDALYHSAIRHILARHEQGAGFIAHGMARATGNTQVAFATSGPGATNIITAIADAKLDSVPLIVITGQVSRALIGTDAFQEIDAYGMTLSITKHNYLVRSANELLTILPEAFRIAAEARPGPVLIDVPKDVQIERIEVKEFPPITRARQRAPEVIALDAAETLARAINASTRPFIYAGGGVIHANASEALRMLAETNSIPVALTLTGLGAFPASHTQCLGLIGMHGAEYTNRLAHAADLIVALGARFDDRATGAIETFCPNAKIMHIDIDAAEIGKIRAPDYALAADLNDALRAIAPFIEKNAREAWMDYIAEEKALFDVSLPSFDAPFHPRSAVREIAKNLSKDDIVCTDVGQHQMWVAQRYPFETPRTLLTSAGLGTMGFGLPAAIGAAIAYPEKRIACISGDGSLLMNIQELATLADLNANVTVIVMNNGHLGLVRQQQELFYDGRMIASKFDRACNFATIAEGFGVKAYALSEARDVAETMRKAFSEKGPALIDMPILETANVLPMTPPGKANYAPITERAYAK